MRSLKKMIIEVTHELDIASEEMRCQDGGLSCYYHERPLLELFEIKEKTDYMSENEFYELVREWGLVDDCMYRKCTSALERVPSERIYQI